MTVEHEVWCISLRSAVLIEGDHSWKLYSYPYCGPVHEQKTNEQLLSPPEIRVLQLNWLEGDYYKDPEL